MFTADINECSTGRCTRGIMGYIVAREYHVERSLSIENGTLQRVLEFGICWFAVRERTPIVARVQTS